jgi:RNA polymerase-binding transcription factor DksA
MSSVEPLPPPPPRAPSTDTGAGGAELDRIEADLSGVEVALDRLDAGTYWTCEVTGERLPETLLATDPVARRLPSAGTSGPSAPTAPPW